LTYPRVCYVWFPGFVHVLDCWFTYVIRSFVTFVPAVSTGWFVVVLFARSFRWILDLLFVVFYLCWFVALRCCFVAVRYPPLLRMTWTLLVVCLPCYHRFCGRLFYVALPHTFYVVLFYVVPGLPVYVVCHTFLHTRTVYTFTLQPHLCVGPLFFTVVVRFSLTVRSARFWAIVVVPIPVLLLESLLFRCCLFTFPCSTFACCSLLLFCCYLRSIYVLRLLLFPLR